MPAGIPTLGQVSVLCRRAGCHWAVRHWRPGVPVWNSADVLKNLRRKMSQSIDDIEDQRLAGRMADFDLTRINDVEARTKVLLAGEVQTVQVVPRAGSPSLEITVSDGTGRAVAVFTGRRRLGGVDCGRRVLIEGVARRERGRLLMMNPAYTIVE